MLDPLDDELRVDSTGSQQQDFESILSEQSTVFQRLYDAAEQRKQQLEKRRESEMKMEQVEVRRMCNVSKVINPRSRAMAEINRGNQDVFERLYDDGKKSCAKKEEEKKRAATHKEQQQLAARPSQYDETRVLEAFQPDIGPAARQYHRKGKLLENLDAYGRRKHQEIQLRNAVQRAQAMEGCTFHPHITQKSKEIASNRRDKSVHEDLYESGLRKRMQRAGLDFVPVVCVVDDIH